MSRLLSEIEIEDILNFITPNEGIPNDVAIVIMNNNKQRIRNQLKNQLVYPEIIPRLKQEIEKQYFSTLVHPGESLGIICAQSIGEKQTQTTLNSLDYKEQILYIKDNFTYIKPIGEFIDYLLENTPPENITHIEENKTEYLPIPDGYYIPSCDDDGNCGWYKIEAITRHLPVGKLVKVSTRSGRTVTATQSKSFLIWDGKKFLPMEGSNLKVGDILPSTQKLPRFKNIEEYLVTESPENEILLDSNFGFLIGSYLVKGQSIMETSSMLLTKLLNKTCNDGTDRIVPEFAYNAPNDFVKGLLDGYFSGNGNIDEKSISVLSTSEKLINGISFLLSYFEIFGYISRIHNTEAKLQYHLSVCDDFVKRFAMEIRLTNGEKQEKLDIMISNEEYGKDKSQEEFPERDVYFDEVISIEYVEGTTPFVYDFTVEKTRNFGIWNGLNCRDSFHSAGLSHKSMTVGVPRFQELLNATKTPKCVNCKLYFNENNDSIEKLRKSVNHTLCGLTFKTISKNINIVLNKQPEFWYEAFKILYNNDFEQYEHCISIKLNTDMLFEFSLKIKDIAAKVFNEYYDLTCVFSPPQIGQLDIFVDTSRITLPEDRILFIDSENAVEIYLEECVQPIIENMLIAGIEGLENIYFVKIPDTEPIEWMIETDGGNLTKILSHPLIDITRTLSNDIWDIYNILGIEAVRQFLIEEYMGIMEGINTCHVKVLVERMTFIGTISSISRYTMRKDDNGILSKISFEETLEGFLQAGSNGAIENTNGVSASIICGKRAQIGTGMMELIIDMDKLPVLDSQISFDDFIEQEEKSHPSVIEDKVFEVEAKNDFKIEKIQDRLDNISKNSVCEDNFEDKINAARIKKKPVPEEIIGVEEVKTVFVEEEKVEKKKSKKIEVEEKSEKKKSKKIEVEDKSEKKKSKKKTLEDIIVQEDKIEDKKHKKKTLEDIITEEKVEEKKPSKKADTKKKTDTKSKKKAVK